MMFKHYRQLLLLLISVLLCGLLFISYNSTSIYSGGNLPATVLLNSYKLHQRGNLSTAGVNTTQTYLTQSLPHAASVAESNQHLYPLKSIVRSILSHSPDNAPDTRTLNANSTVKTSQQTGADKPLQTGAAKVTAATSGPVGETITYRPDIEMRRRAAEVMNRCILRKRDMYSPSNKYIATMNTKSYAYYPIAKVGWTTWMYVMFEHAGKAEEPSNKGFKWGWSSPYGHAGMKLVTRLSELKTYNERLLFVRNPWDRLVSAYKNKALNGPYSLWLHTPCKWLKEGMPALTFPQFTQCIVDTAHKYGGTGGLESQSVARKLDIHWTPQYWSSMPCSSNYTLIGQFDHMTDDMTAAIKILHLNSTGKARNSAKSHQDKPLAYWYNQLSYSVTRDLQKIYSRDFEIFGFDSTIPS